MSVARSLAYAAVKLLHPRMLWLMLWPMLVAAALWGTAALALWTRLAVRIADWLRAAAQSALSFTHLDFGGAALAAAHVLLFLAFVPLVYLTALVLVSLFGMQQIVDHVAAGSFAALERRHGGGAAGAVWNALVGLLGVAVLALVTLPLWLFAPLWPLIALLILGWLNQRLLRYDALAEHADREEMRRIFRARRRALYLLGVLLALAAYVPLLGFLAPVLFGIAFVHYLLSALREERASAPARAVKASGGR